ncbi:MAG: sulfite exporter TauE/SafE family protein, partial [Cucumibacter sp.]
LGVGGGIVIVPALSFVLTLLGYDPAAAMHVAVATSLAVIVPTGFRSAQAHHRRGAVDFGILRLWGPFIVVASLAGGLMAGLYSSGTLRVIFGVTAILIALNIVLPVQKRLMGAFAATSWAHRISASVIGYISALMGIGGGSLSVPTLSVFGVPIHTAVGTASALGVLLAIPGAIGFIVSGWLAEGRPPFSFGYVNLPALLVLGVVASLVAPAGAALAHRLPARALQTVFAVYLVVIGGRMLWQSLAG